MTVIESIFGGLVLAMLTGLLGNLLGTKGKVTTEEFNKHKDSTIPHSACPVHAEKFITIEGKLTSIEQKIDKLIER